MKPSETFNNEDSNRSQNPDFDEVLSSRLSRRHVLRGAASAAGLGAAERHRPNGLCHGWWRGGAAVQPRLPASRPKAWATR